MWLAWIIQSDLENNWKEILPKSFLWLFIALIIGIISQFFNVLIFSKFLRINITKYNFFQIAKLFFTGQIIRYMPGRIWGILYQVMNSLPDTPKKNIVLANIELMFVAFSGLLTVSTAIIIFFTKFWYFSLPVVIFGLTFMILVLRNGWLTIIITIANTFLRKNKQEVTFLPLNLKICFSAVSLFLFGWVIYLVGWVAIGEAGYGAKSTYTMLLLASTYSISWFLGYISMITPSGIGIREASFLVLSQEILPSSELALLAIVIRLWLLVIDFILFLIFYPVKSSKEI